MIRKRRDQNINTMEILKNYLLFDSQFYIYSMHHGLRRRVRFFFCGYKFINRRRLKKWCDTVTRRWWSEWMLLHIYWGTRGIMNDMGDVCDDVNRIVFSLCDIIAKISLCARLLGQYVYAFLNLISPSSNKNWSRIIFMKIKNHVENWGVGEGLNWTQFYYTRTTITISSNTLISLSSQALTFTSPTHSLITLAHFHFTPTHFMTYLSCTHFVTYTHTTNAIQH